MRRTSVPVGGWRGGQVRRRAGGADLVGRRPAGTGPAPGRVDAEHRSCGGAGGSTRQLGRLAELLGWSSGRLDGSGESFLPFRPPHHTQPSSSCCSAPPPTSSTGSLPNFQEKLEVWYWKFGFILKTAGSLRKYFSKLQSRFLKLPVVYTHMAVFAARQNETLRRSRTCISALRLCVFASLRCCCCCCCQW